MSRTSGLLAAVTVALLGFVGSEARLPAQTVKPRSAATASAAAHSQAAPVDLTGVWRRMRQAPDKSRKYTIYELTMAFSLDVPAMTPWGEAQFMANRPSLGPRSKELASSNDPTLQCFPPGVPRIYLMRAEPMEILQPPGRVVMLFEYDHFIRNIFADGRPHPVDPPPSWMGDAVAKWDGDTLVVDTIGFNDKTWLDNDGHPHTEDMHLVERIRRIRHDRLTIDSTIEDPKVYSKPWAGHAVFELKPDWTLGEMVCEDNRTFNDMQKKSEGGR